MTKSCMQKNYREMAMSLVDGIEWRTLMLSKDAYQWAKLNFNQDDLYVHVNTSFHYVDVSEQAYFLLKLSFPEYYVN